MIIFLRGLPGSGKTTIADLLGKRLGWLVVHVDESKTEYMNAHPDASFKDEVVPHAQKIFMEKLESYKDEDLVVEETFWIENFVINILEFCEINRINSKWFLIERDMSQILETNEARTRRIKNTPSGLQNMSNRMKDIKIDGEIVVDNMNIEDSVETIYNSITNHI